MFSTSIRLPEDIRDRLERLAKKTSRSKSYYIHEAIYMHLAELEQLYFTESELIESKRSKVAESQNMKNSDADC